EFVQVSGDALFHLLHARLHLALGEVLVAVVDRLELAAVDRDDRLREQIESAADLDELAAHPPDARAVVLAEVGDRLEVRCETPSQPDELEIALSLALEPPARLDAIQVAVDVDPQQRRRVIRGPPRRRRLDTCETQRTEIETVDEDVDHPD